MHGSCGFQHRARWLRLTDDRQANRRGAVSLRRLSQRLFSQFHNAAAFEATGAAVVAEQSSLKPESLLAALCPLIDDTAMRTRMRNALAAWHHPESAAEISRRILGLQSLPAGSSQTSAGSNSMRPCLVT